MASFGLIQSALNGLPANLRSALTTAFSELANRLSLAPTEDAMKSPNCSAWRFDTTTAATVNGEFIIAHGRGVAPKALIPILPLTATSYQVVPLTQSRAADAERIYLSSPTVNARVSVLVEF